MQIWYSKVQRCYVKVGIACTLHKSSEIKFQLQWLALFDVRCASLSIPSKSQVYFSCPSLLHPWSIWGIGYLRTPYIMLTALCRLLPPSARVLLWPAACSFIDQLSRRASQAPSHEPSVKGSTWSPLVIMNSHLLCVLFLFSRKIQCFFSTSFPILLFLFSSRTTWQHASLPFPHAYWFANMYFHCLMLINRVLPRHVLIMWRGLDMVNFYPLRFFLLVFFNSTELYFSVL